MGEYISRYCPNCKYEIEKFKRKYFAIGSPFVTCPNCSSESIVSHIREWEMLNPFQKVGDMIRHVFTCAVFSFIFFALPYIIFVELTGGDSNTIPDSIAIPILSVGFLVIFIFRTPAYINEVKESRERTNNKDYRLKLSQNNLL